MKFKIKKKIRLGLIAITVISIMIFAYLVYNEAYNPGFEEKKIPSYSYDNKGSINYEIYLKPNNLYTEDKLGEGKLYITEFVDYIDTDLKYEFTGERDAEINGNYDITAKVKGYMGDGEKITNIWEKDFPIKQVKEFNNKDGKVSINEKVNLNIDEYNLFVQDIKEASKINCQASLTLSMNVNLEGTTDKGSIEEIMSPSITIPLDVQMFEITGNNIIDKPAAIEETVDEPLPVNKSRIIGYAVILAVFVIALIILIFFTAVSPVKDSLEKALGKIFKKHGERLVALDSDIDIQDAITVKTINDLVKISDEIGKPILYKYSDDYKEINKFYVSNEDEAFVFSLEYLIDVEQIEETENTSSDNTIA
ncbi:DUF5305 domain-containing protein [Sedimentibacter hydroxybenzoicus DSM 7310]|uniref:DUF5305 domain-containing protein n=1 Tax=Sedimentibacter hydroxybenzoicus DSM 7310 TaxID=1123245 RepID=A0A974GWA7_SEDHY|nr:DUF5305 domain-containing protein [Sedimentibacter hydroxybenzoicus]NYB74274.1 DUF5305 domain-containing protein [Sedimentibacter hydroxybenzoicus DSM 7310]